jgi:uncharacterized protein YjiS (DUF1127 family)
MRFLHCCGATLLLSVAVNLPMFRATNSPVSTGFKRKRKVMFAAIVRFIREWKSYNRSLSELSRLGDRELADIGISRSDIHRVAWKAAHQH